MATRPFPRLNGLKTLTWDECFQLTRSQIRHKFIDAIVTNATATADNPTRKLAKLLFFLTEMDENNEKEETLQRKRPQSIAIVKPDKINQVFPATEYPKIVDLPAEVTHSSILGRVAWSPKGTRLVVWCHTIFDLLAACMSDAASLAAAEKTAPTQTQRTKANYFAKLAALYSYWCLRLAKSVARAPAMTGIACLGDDGVVLLQCSIPAVPGDVADPAAHAAATETEQQQPVSGKELIRRSRYADLEGRGRREGSHKQILDLTKIGELRQSYGNCAETWSFALCCLQDEQNLQNIFGVAVNIPKKDVTAYVEANERTYNPKSEGDGRYAQLCGNCRKLITQIAMWESKSAKDAVVKNFNVYEWTLKQ